MKIRKLFLYIRGIPKTIIFNFWYFPFKTAIHFPVLISHRVVFAKLRGRVKIESQISFGMIKIGFFENRAFDHKRERAVWHNEGEIVFIGHANFGNGTKIAVTGRFICGNNVIISGNTQLVCGATIKIGDNSLIGWKCILLDYDAHKIYKLDNLFDRTNTKDSIEIGEHVWIAANVVITKGVKISNGCVIAANSIVYKDATVKNAIWGGNPIKIIKENIYWKA